MINKLIGTKNQYVVSGNCGMEFNKELKKLKKQLKAEGRRIETKVIVKAIILTESL